jgi:hypothetical protein
MTIENILFGAALVIAACFAAPTLVEAWMRASNRNDPRS